MSMVTKFIEQLKNRGLRIEGPNPNDPPETLRIKGPTIELTPQLLAAMKAFRPQLVEIYGRQPAHPGVATDAPPDTGAPETPGEHGGPAMTESLACRACGVRWELAATTADKALLCDRILTCPEKKKVDWVTIPSHSITGSC